MTTPDDVAVDPGTAAAPSPPSPGVSAGVLRVPTSPTLPELDPVSLTLVLSRMANELFKAPAVASAAAPTGVSAVTHETDLVRTPDLAGAPPALAAAPAASVATASLPVTTAAPAGSPVTAAPAGLPVTTAAPAGSPVTAAPAGLPATTPASAAPPTGSGYSNPFAAEPQLDTLFGQESLSDFGVELFSLPLVDTAPSPSPQTAAPTPAPHQPAYQLEPILSLELPAVRTGFDAPTLRQEFPILGERVHGKRLVWLDNAATTQKPKSVIDRLTYFYEHENSNIHRAAHTLAARATDAYEAARESVRRFLHAPAARDIVFVRGATEGINLVAQSWGRRNIEAGDEIIVSLLEHHANIVPWQQLCAEKGARLRVIPVDDRGQLLLEAYERLLGPKTKLVAVTQVSNALGSVTPAKTLVEMAHRHGARVLLDGAQAVSHMQVDVQALDCDFLVFSGHKVFAPTGIGVVYGKAEVLDSMPPWQGGGNMIQDVTFERTLYQPPPARFEAGTGSLADAVGLGAALDWLTRVGVVNVSRYEHELLEYGTRELGKIAGLKLIGTAAEKAGVLSFTLAGHSSHDIATFLDQEGIAVRSGHHCAQPILRRFGLESTVRASLAPYNTKEDLDALVTALSKIAGA